jgi:hypothetical protein
LFAAHEDPKRGPLTKFDWSITRLGKGKETQYIVDRVRRDTDLVEDWELDPEKIAEIAASAVKYDQSAIYVSTREEHLEVARSLVR